MNWSEWLHSKREGMTLVLRAILAGFLVLALVITVYLIAEETAFYRAVGPRSAPTRVPGRLLPVSAPSVDTVSEWMTFEYLNRVFALPQGALAQELGISDARYPRLSIHRWAIEAGLDEATAVLRVKSAIRVTQAAKP